MHTRFPTILTLLAVPAAALAGFNFQHNVFVAGDAQLSNSDVEGALAVGGNAQLSSYSVGLLLPNGHTGDTLSVGGNLSFSHGTVWHGDASYAGTANLTLVGFPNGNSAIHNPSLDFTGLASYYQSHAQYFSTLTQNGSWLSQFGTLTLTAAGSGLNVFNLTTADLAGVSTLRIVAPSGGTALVNIGGATAAFQNMGMSLSGGITESHVLYNFFSATSLNLSGIGVLGSILAPNAATTFNSGVVLGSGAVGGLSGIGQWNNYQFDGELPNVPAVPVPGAALLGLVGTGALGLRRSR